MTDNPGKPDKYKVALREFGASLGELVFHWNNLHEHLSAIFTNIVSSSNPKTAASIWHSLDSDALQRKILRSALEQSSTLTATQKENIIWILNQIEGSGGLRHKRNDAIHSPMSYLLGSRTDDVSIIPDFTSLSPRAVALWKSSNVNLRTYLDTQSKWAAVLATFAAGIGASLRRPSSAPWPQKPPLPHAHRTKSRKGSSRQSSAK